MQTDKKTLELINTVRRQKEEIARIDRPVFKTNCSFAPVEGSTTGVVNLHAEGDVKKLLDIVGFLTCKQEYYNKAAERLGVDSYPPYTWGGYPVNEWLDDIRARIGKVQIASKRKKLEALEDRLNKIVSPELRAKLELEAIAEELGG